MDLFETLGVEVSLSTVHRTLALLGYTRKKLSKTALERCQAARDLFLFNIGDEHPQQLVFTDESAVNILTTYRSMGHAPKGSRACKHTYFQRGDRFSILPALSLRGIIHVNITRGSFNGDSFLAYIGELVNVMNPYPQPESVLVMDNCAIHHVDGVMDLCTEKGVKLIYLPPYSPDFNPIEECFSFMKGVIRRHGAQFRAAVDTKDDHAVHAFLTDVLSMVTPSHVEGWFQHSNYL